MDNLPPLSQGQVSPGPVRDRTAVEKILTEVLSPKCHSIVLFGSAARDALRPDSDVDVGVLWKEQNPSREERANVVGALESKLGREVDLVSLAEADLIICMQALFAGHLVWSHAPSEFITFKAMNLSQYQDFKFSRRIIEASLDKDFPYARR